MGNTEKMFQHLRNQMEQGCDSVLVTIIEASGSLPRGMGAHMAVGRSGRSWGTIGGGALEYQAIQTAQELCGSTECCVKKYDLSNAQAAGLGMVCGGRAKVLFYPLLSEEEQCRSFVEAGYLAERSGEPYRLQLPLEAGGAAAILPETGSGGTVGNVSEEPGCDVLDEQGSVSEANRCDVLDEQGSNVSEAKRCNVLDEQGCSVTERDGIRYYVECAGQGGRVYLFGGGHLAQETAPLLAHLGFRCIVMDDREEFARPELFPGAERTAVVDFERLERYAYSHKEADGKRNRCEDPDKETDECSKSDLHLRVRKEDYLLIMTRGHQCDAAVERFALRTPAHYIGVVGSRKKAAYVRGLLAAEGFADEDLDRVITPVGLDIGGDTPAEIAVSIAAQLIQVRAQNR